MDDKLTLMLVEDDPLTCKDIFTELTACSDDFALVGITNNAARAMECVTEYCPDAIVVDLELKDGTSEGLSFLQTLKNSGMAPLPFILAITGSNDPDVRGSARECGADFIMGKSDAGFSAQNIADGESRYLQVRTSVCPHGIQSGAGAGAGRYSLYSSAYIRSAVPTCRALLTHLIDFAFSRA